MAVEGTSIPSDSAQHRYIKSIPRPDQIDDPSRLGQSQLSAAATDMPQCNKDIGTTSEVIRSTGDQLPVQVESKRMHLGANEPLAKGYDRYHKHHRQQESGFERFAGEGAEVDEAPGDEGEDQDTIWSRKGVQGQGGIQ